MFNSIKDYFANINFPTQTFILSIVVIFFVWLYTKLLDLFPDKKEFINNFAICCFIGILLFIFIAINIKVLLQIIRG